ELGRDLGRLGRLLARAAPALRSLFGLRLWRLFRSVFFGWSHRLLPVPACPRYSRVGANSPSLWPTIDSVMNTGMCLRPSWTAIVCPSIAGTIIDRLDHVLMTVLVPLSFWPSTFFIRWSSTKGPFLRLRGIACCSYRLFLPRRRLISRSLGLCARRVRPSGLPHGLTGWRPPELLPSPPPSGWSTGFIATPRTDGRLPFHRFRPAL